MAVATTYRADWQGIALSLTHTPAKWPGFDQIEVESEGRAALPVTPTGYKVSYLRAEDLAEYASPVAFVLAWLDFAAEDQGWTGQLSLL